MHIPEKIQQIRVPLAWAVTIIIAAFAIDARYVAASDFKEYQNTSETRLVERDIRQLDNEILRLRVKKEHYPEQLNAVDKELLRKYEMDRQELRQDLAKLKSK